MVKSSWAACELLMLDKFVNKLCSLGLSLGISKMSKLELARARYMVLVTHHYSTPQQYNVVSWHQLQPFCNFFYILYWVHETWKMFCVWAVWKSETNINKFGHLLDYSILECFRDMQINFSSQLFSMEHNFFTHSLEKSRHFAVCSRDVKENLRFCY